MILSFFILFQARLQLFRAVGLYERVDHIIHLAVQKCFERVNGIADTVIGYSALRIVIGTDSFASVAGSDL